MEAKINRTVDAKSKMIYKVILLLSFIGFLVYLSVIISGYVAYLFGVTSQKFDLIFLGLAIIGIISFGICSYLTCFKNKKN